MAPVTEGFLFGCTASAEGERLVACQFVAILVDQGQAAFDEKRPVFRHHDPSV